MKLNVILKIFLQTFLVVVLWGIGGIEMGCSNRSKSDSSHPFGYHALRIHGQIVNHEIFLKEKNRFFIRFRRNAEILRKSDEERMDLILEEIINQVVIDDYLHNQVGITVTSREVNNYIDRYIKTKYASPSDFDHFMHHSEYGDETELQKGIELYLLKLKCFSKLAKEMGFTIPPTELDSLYRMHLNENHLVVTRRILISDSDSTNARQQANELYHQLKSGADFSLLAGQYLGNEGATSTGGLQPPLPRNGFDSIVAEKIFNADSGEVLPAFKNGAGYEIIQVERFLHLHHPKEEFADMILLEKFGKSKEFNTLIMDLKSKVSIEILDPAMKAYRLYCDSCYNQAGTLYENLFWTEHKEHHLQRAIDSFQMAKNWRKLIQLGQTGMRTFPKNIAYSLNRAEGLYRKGKVTDALKLLQNAKSLSQGNIFLQGLVAETYSKLGLTKDAE